MDSYYPQAGFEPLVRGLAFDSAANFPGEIRIDIAGAIGLMRAR